MKRKLSKKLLLKATIFLAVLLALSWWFRPGVYVSIHNSGSMEMKGVVVEVTGKTYAIGNIARGATSSCRVHSTGESDIKISYQLEDGSVNLHSVDCYIEPGYRGSISTEIRNGELVQKPR